MTRLLDIHTHHAPREAGTAILNCSPEEFMPQPHGWYSVGIHPWHLPASLRSVSDETIRIFAHPQVLAIGEAGIDKLSQTNLSLQINIFEQHARLAEQLGKPLIIHAVRATDELIKLKKSIRPTQAWIIHGFRGKAALADEYIRQGFYLSFGDKYQEEALRTMPVERFFIETDESTTPVDALYERAAALRNTPPEAFKEAIRQNIERLFF